VLLAHSLAAPRGVLGPVRILASAPYVLVGFCVLAVACVREMHKLMSSAGVIAGVITRREGKWRHGAAPSGSAPGLGCAHRVQV
jgi:hypothetical protein